MEPHISGSSSLKNYYSHMLMIVLLRLIVEAHPQEKKITTL